MNIPQIISKVTRQPWLITDDKLSAIMSAIEVRQSGGFQALDYDESDMEEEGIRHEYREFQSPAGTVAVIPVHGILGKHLSSLEMACGGCSLDTLQSQIKTAMNSSRISKVLFDINSPGGTVTGTPETAKLIRALSEAKQTWAFTDSDCCSGALWLASQCSVFYATESASVGSVGVRMVLLDYTRQLEQDGVKVNSISSGKYKLLGAPFKPLEDEEREMLQAESDMIYAEFKGAVSSVRPVADDYLQGQIFRGEEAAGIGMTDGTSDDLDSVLSLMLTS